ncbi:MAG: AAA family ATPase [Acidobacteria bacterium]|nr:AAA family ATPase [Acidobacteriota bacterium]
MIAVEQIRAALYEKGYGRGPTHFTCPVCGGQGTHERPALSTHGEHGVKCHRGDCRPKDILAALGFDPAGNMERRLEAVYRYRNEAGETIFETVRLRDPKDFRQRHPRAGGGYSYSLNGCRRVPYRLPELIEAVKAGKTVYIPEGEKDCDSLSRIGLDATTNPMGACKWAPELSPYLKGANVVILPDNDHKGREHAQDVARKLSGIAKSIKILALPSLPEKGDVSDWIAAGGTREALEKMAGDVPPLAENAPPSGPLPVLVTLADVEPEEVSWIWTGRVARGKLTLLDGDPGTGKSTLALNLAAAISTGGILPGGDRVNPADVVILSAEDGAADTIRPRIDAAGGDPRRIHLLTAVSTSEGEEAPDLCSHIPIIRAAVEKTKAALVIIDPLMAYLGPDVNSHRDQDIRRTLSPLSKMAEETGAALLVVRHLNKSAGGQAIYRGGGSIGIAGAARVVLLVAKDPEDEERRILAVVKNNLAKFPDSLAFRLQSVGHVARVEWDSEPVSYTADELLAVSAQDPDSQEERDEKRTAKKAAAEWLTDLLMDGPVPSEEIPDIAKKAGLSWATVRRAKETLGVVSQRIGPGRNAPWEWRLPEPIRKGRNFGQPEHGKGDSSHSDAHSDAPHVQAKNLEHLEHLDEHLIGKPDLQSPAGGVTSPYFEAEEEAV